MPDSLDFPLRSIPIATLTPTEPQETHCFTGVLIENWE